MSDERLPTDDNSPKPAPQAPETPTAPTDAARPQTDTFAPTGGVDTAGNALTPPPGDDDGDDDTDETGAAARPDSPRSFWRRWRKTLFLSALFVALLIITVLATLGYMVNQYVQSGQMRQMLLAKLSAMLGRPVELGEVGFEFPTVTANRLRIAGIATGSPDLAVVERLIVTPDPWELLSGRVSIDGFLLSSASLHLRQRPDGSWELPGALVESSEPTAQPASQPATLGAFPLRSLQVRNLHLVLDTRDRGVQRLTVAKFDLGNTLGASLLNVEGEMTLANTARAAFSGKLDWPREVSGAFALDQINQQGLKRWLPPTVTLPGEIDQTTLKANLTLALTTMQLTLHSASLAVPQGPQLEAKGTATLDATRPVVNLNGKLAPMSATRLRALAGPYLPATAKGVSFPAGQIGGDFVVSLPAGGELQYESNIKVTGLDINESRLPAPIKGLSGAAEIRNGQIKLSGLSAAIPGVKLAIRSFAVTLAPAVSGGGEVDCTVDLRTFFPVIKGFLPEIAVPTSPEGQVRFAGPIGIDAGGPRLGGSLELSNVSLTPMPSQPRLQDVQGRLSLHEVTAKSGRIVVDSLAGSLAGVRLSVGGSLAPTATGMQFALNATGVADLADLHRQMPLPNIAFQKKTQLGGALTVHARLGGALPKPTLSAEAALDKGRFAWPEKGLAIENIKATVLGDLDSVVVKTLVASAANGRLVLAGSVKQFAQPVLAASGTLAGVELRDVRRLVQMNVASFPGELEIEGRTDLVVQISGPALSPSVHGTVQWRNGRFFHPGVLRPLTGVEGTFTFDNQTLSTRGLKFAWGTTAAAITGSVRDLSRFDCALDYKLDPLDAGDAAGFFLTGTGYTFTGKGTGQGKVLGPVSAIRVEGQATLPSAEFKAPVDQAAKSHFRFPLTGVSAAMKFHAGVLTVPSLKAQLFGGPITGSGKVDTNPQPLQFSFDVKGDQVRLEQMMAVNTKYPNAAKGGANLALACSGNTTGLASMQGSGSFSLPDGEYHSPPVLVDILSTLQLQKFANGRLTNSGGPFLVENGNIKVQNLVLTSPEGKLTYTGLLGLDTSLSGDAEFWVNAATAKTSPVLARAAGPDGVTVPVRVRGSVTSPQLDVKLDKLLQKAAENQVQNLLEKALRDKLGGGAGSGAPAPGGTVASGAAPVPAGTTASQPVPAPPPAQPTNPVKQIEKQIEQKIDTEIGNALDKLFGGKKKKK